MFSLVSRSFLNMSKGRFLFVSVCYEYVSVSLCFLLFLWVPVSFISVRFWVFPSVSECYSVFRLCQSVSFCFRVFSMCFLVFQFVSEHFILVLNITVCFLCFCVSCILCIFFSFRVFTFVSECVTVQVHIFLVLYIVRFWMCFVSERVLFLSVSVGFYLAKAGFLSASVCFRVVLMCFIVFPFLPEHVVVLYCISLCLRFWVCPSVSACFFVFSCVSVRFWMCPRIVNVSMCFNCEESNWANIQKWLPPVSGSSLRREKNVL